MHCPGRNLICSKLNLEHHARTKMSAPSVASVKELIAQKDALEAELKELMDVLESQGGVGMDGPILDEEQYPRSDIDVYTVRHARHRIACLQNDHKAKMKEIEENLYQLHEEARKQKEQAMEVDSSAQETKVDTAIDEKPFAKIDRVDSGSPASQAGLTLGDEIIEFGSVNVKNFTTLQNIATVVQHSQGSPLHVTVLRQGERTHLSLTPQTWSGKGLLGCNIVPLKR
ncbi:26S proteasome non-ATPase regulatory subunit 9-like [Lingula anatina]|uniref:26S proteasome non-ATPase regulatory subunit 9 n=1 Tax=Lingula anatina TaxID=7574 RepID=A0A1S3JYQ9_LINAN|nr:26S proteasome non-ATPase regulatory subunit 9-like [Lingula anatina]|eukprot:XP_013415550.1 26S proteasome non-ATPase regulatory subunit 9-like [Lingula anatina]